MRRTPTKPDLAALQHERLTRRAQQSLHTFVRWAWPVLEPATPFVDNWHLPLLCEYLECVSAGSIRRLVINMPPRYGKSLLVSVLWPVWEWITTASGRWIFASYSDGLASRHSLDRRRLILSPWFQARWGQTVTLTRDQQAKREFHNTRRGMMIATSVGGSITGKGGNRLVIDDPHNPEQAESDVQRTRALDFYTQTLSTRLDDKAHAATVLVMHRLHTEDLAGLCLDLGFDHVALPALAPRRTTIVFPRSGRSHVRDADTPLWPARESVADLERQRLLLGSYGFAGQYQQEPVPRTGGLFQRDWWQWYDEAPVFDEMVQSWDLAFKDGTASDYVVGLAVGRVGMDYYVLDRFKQKASFVETCHAITAMVARYPDTSRVLVEDAANGPAVVDALHHQVIGLTPVQPQGGKFARAAAIQPVIESGHVWLPKPRLPGGRLLPDRCWVDDFVTTCAAFPKGAHDDDVDALTQLLVYFRHAPKPDAWGYLQYAMEESRRLHGLPPPPVEPWMELPTHRHCEAHGRLDTWEETDADGVVRVRCRGCRIVLDERRPPAPAD